MSRRDQRAALAIAGTQFFRRGIVGCLQSDLARPSVQRFRGGRRSTAAVESCQALQPALRRRSSPQNWTCVAFRNVAGPAAGPA
jgi:hypothetical protein